MNRIDYYMLYITHVSYTDFEVYNGVFNYSVCVDFLGGRHSDFVSLVIL